MAKQMPWAGAMMAVFTPITLPRRSTSGPPELPGLSAASVWMTLSMSRPVVRAQRAAQRAHHARRHRGLEAVRIADGHHQLAHLQGAGVAEGAPAQARRVDADHGEVGVGIVADELGAAVGGRRRASRRGDPRACTTWLLVST